MKLPSDDRRTLEHIQQRFADADSEWWPFGFLRPEQHEEFTMGRCGVLALLYGVPAIVLAVMLGQMLGEPIPGRSLALFSAAVYAIQFAILRTFVASFWNQRASRLRPLHERRVQWQRSRSE